MRRLATAGPCAAVANFPCCFFAIVIRLHRFAPHILMKKPRRSKAKLGSPGLCVWMRTEESLARQGTAGHGMVRLGKSRRALAGRGRDSTDSQGEAWRGKARLGLARQGGARWGLARRGRAGMAII